MSPHPSSRHYDDPCGIARALDAVGERWALLVVRELVFEPKRFKDLRAGLGGVSPNVLTQRLAELEQSGVVRRRAMGPPVGATVYELTTHGRDLLPVLDALARWGSQRPIQSAKGLSRNALMLAMQTSMREGMDLPDPITVILDATSQNVAIDGGVLAWGDHAGREPRARIDTDTSTLRALAFGGVRLEGAIEAGSVLVAGDLEYLEAFLSGFQRRQLPEE
jgi:DNA-binding HxlR family transcriptional regulator